MRRVILGAVVVSLVGCNFDPTGAPNHQDQAEPTAKVSNVNPADDPLGARDPAVGAPPDASLADDLPRPIMQAQIVLDRLGFTPGVVDGHEGLSTRNALIGFQEATSLAITGKLDRPTEQALARWGNIPATRLVTIPADFAAGPFEELPEQAPQQAKLTTLGYETLDEKLAERFHTTIETLKALNPEIAGSSSDGPARKSPVSYFKAGQRIRVPNVGADRIDPSAVSEATWLSTLAALGVGSSQPKAARIVVSKAKRTLKVYDASDKLVGMFTATMGSQRDPLPLGNWKVTGIARNPPFHYNPKLFWDVPDNREKQLLPPGPNGPVGVAWIDINKEHYGIHGTPEPQTIGRAESHGCVRLTNWDAARLVQMVSVGTKVQFDA